jgi:ABC-type multidrug transport system ATPase subunit
MQNMTQTTIKTKHLNFGFSKQNQVLKDINLEVERGTIYGFLGQNGAGKTTTIRLLLGLLKSPANCIQLFGEEINKKPIEIFKKCWCFYRIAIIV